MIALAFAADVHLGNHKRFGGELVAGLNARGRLSVAALMRATEIARDQDVSDFFVLGDLFDDDRPNPQLIAATQCVFGLADCPAPHVMVGNHDATSDAVGHHALAPLLPVADVVDAPRVIRLTRGRDAIEIGLIPYMPRPAATYLAEALQALEWSSSDATRLLGIHAGVKDASTPPWLRDSTDAIDVDELAALAAEHGIDTIFAGNWHDHRRWSLEKKGRAVRVIQIGSLCPTGFDDLSPQHGIALWRDGDISFADVPGPRFAKVSNAVELGARCTVEAAAGNALYASWSVAPGDLAASTAAAEAYDLAAVEVLPDARLLEVQAREAAEGARASSTLDEALAAFVQAMPLPDGVEREAVLARARGYL